MDKLSLGQELSRLLQERILRNSRYSLRALARDLEMDPSYLSKIISGKRIPPKTFYSKMARVFQLEEGTLIEKFHRSKGEIVREKFAKGTINPSKLLKIASWEFPAVLELMQIPGFEPNLKNISESLSITEKKAKRVVQALVDVGLLEVYDGDKFRVQSPDQRARGISEPPTQGVQMLTQSLMKKVYDATSQPPGDMGLISGTVMKMNINHIQEAVRLLHDIRHQFVKEYDKVSDEESGVYLFSVNLVPLSKSHRSQPNLQPQV